MILELARLNCLQATIGVWLIKWLLCLSRIVYHGASTPEAEMEKIRYYVELPGDLYEDGYFMDLVKIAMGPLRTEEGRVPHHLLLRQNQTYLELQVVDPTEA